MRVLVVEDEEVLRDTIGGYLETEGFLCTGVSTRADALDCLASADYDIVVLDITLPDGSGLDLLNELRDEHPGTGTLIVSARDSLDDRLQGLDLGADDYVTKPFHLAELNARIRAVMRRRGFEMASVLTIHEIEIDARSREVRVRGRTVDLTPTEYRLLLYFVTNRNRVLTRESLSNHIWGNDLGYVDNYDFIYTHVKNLRRKIGRAGGEDPIKNVYGVGYVCADR